MQRKFYISSGKINKSLVGCNPIHFKFNINQGLARNVYCWRFWSNRKHWRLFAYWEEPGVAAVAQADRGRTALSLSNASPGRTRHGPASHRSQCPPASRSCPARLWADWISSSPSWQNSLQIQEVRFLNVQFMICSTCNLPSNQFH